MQKWISTSQHWFWCGPDVDERLSESRLYADGIHDWFYYSPNISSLKKKMAEFVQHANEQQEEIKTVIPLQGSNAKYSMFADKHQWNSANAGLGWGMGAGAGFGASYTGGFLIILQSSENVSQEEYDSRMQALRDDRIKRQQAQEKEAELAELQSDLEGLKAELETPVKAHEWAKLCLSKASDIELKKNMFGKQVYKCGGKSFDTQVAAEDYRTSLSEDEATAKARVDKINNTILAANEMIHNLKKEIT